MQNRIIGHLDMDAFFASVEEATTPSFKGKPIVVGSDPNKGRGRGVVSTANYKARAYGIHSALPISTAWKLSEEAKKQGNEGVIFLPVDFSLYNKVSANILQIIKKYSAMVEQASIDEFYFLVSEGKEAETNGRKDSFSERTPKICSAYFLVSEGKEVETNGRKDSFSERTPKICSAYFDENISEDYCEAIEVCKKIKREVREKEKVTCSVAIAPNKLLAKIATGVKKPDGLFAIQEKDAQNFLNPLSIREIPGIGPKTEEFLNKKGIKKISDALKFSKEELSLMLGKHGESIYCKVRGIDDSPIAEYRQVKSIGEQTTFEKNTLDAVFIHNALKKLSDNVFKNFQNSDFQSFKTITITVRFADFQTKTSSKSFKDAITKENKKKFEIEVLKLLLAYLDKRANPERKLIRLVGVRLENLF